MGLRGTTNFMKFHVMEVWDNAGKKFSVNQFTQLSGREGGSPLLFFI